MKAFTIYRIGTLEILRSGSCLDADIDLQIHDDTEAMVQDVAADPVTQSVAIVNGVASIVARAVTPVTLAQKKAEMLAFLAERRWQIETSGVQWGGALVETDDRSKLLVASAADRARRDDTFTTRWKTESGWVTLNAAQCIALYDVVFGHVANCFAREAQLADSINATGTISDAEAFRSAILTFWP